MNVLDSSGASVFPSGVDLAAFSTAAFPRVSDAPEPVAVKISGRLLESYGAEPERVEHDTP